MPKLNMLHKWVMQKKPKQAYNQILTFGGILIGSFFVQNFIGQVTRNHHDIQDIRHQVEQAKLRLTTDVKVK